LSNDSRKPRAIVVGHEGQDGQLLSQLLLSRGYGVIGIGRSGASLLGTSTPVPEIDLTDKNQVLNMLAGTHPDEVYYLAASHVSSEGRHQGDTHAQYAQSHTANQLGILNFLEAIRLGSPSTRFFFASSCLIFGARPPLSPQDENTPVQPDEPYGWAKCIAADMCATYRKRHNVMASVGILYNHESHLRRPGFFSRKVADGVRHALKDPKARITVGNLDAVNDWGHASDFVEAFTRILKLDTPGDFIIATGEGHTVREFLEQAYASQGLDWHNHVDIDGALLARKKSGHIGNPAKLKKLTGWQPTMSFSQMIQSLVDHHD
jgi:GDPmannose 4,6-dehydratase